MGGVEEKGGRVRRNAEGYRLRRNAKGYRLRRNAKGDSSKIIIIST